MPRSPPVASTLLDVPPRLSASSSSDAPSRPYGPQSTTNPSPTSTLDQQPARPLPQDGLNKDTPPSPFKQRFWKALAGNGVIVIEWIPDKLNWTSLKPIIRCSLAVSHEASSCLRRAEAHRASLPPSSSLLLHLQAWIGLLLILIGPSQRSLGQASFFTLIGTSSSLVLRLLAMITLRADLPFRPSPLHHSAREDLHPGP